MAEQFLRYRQRRWRRLTRSAPGWRRTIWRRYPRCRRWTVVLAGNAVIPTIDAACRLAAVQRSRC